MVSKPSRRLGVYSRGAGIALLAFAVALSIAAPAFASSVKSVTIRVEGSSATLFTGVRAVRSTTIADSTGRKHEIAANPLAALDLAARIGAFPYVVKESAWGLGVDSVNGELPVPADPYPGWMYRVNGVSLPVGANVATLAVGDEVLWYYGTWDASPTVAQPSAKLVKVGRSLRVTAKQLDMQGVGSALSGATVHVGSRVATSGPNGDVTLPMNAVGDYGVRVEKAGCIRSALVTVRVRRPAALDRPAASATIVAHGSSAVVSTVLASGATKLAGKSVRLWHRAAGTAVWIAGQIKTTGLAGGVGFTVTPSRSTYYRIAFAGDGTYAPVTSAPKLVVVAVR